MLGQDLVVATLVSSRDPMARLRATDKGAIHVVPCRGQRAETADPAHRQSDRSGRCPAAETTPSSMGGAFGLCSRESDGGI